MIIALPIGAGGVVDILGPEQVIQSFEHLGYPLYFAPMLGVAKVLGTVALLVPKFPRLKEWAYAGITFDLVAASGSHLASGDGVGEVGFPIVLLAILFGSYFLRPASRKL